MACAADGCGLWPGLHGGFLFDDFANLPALGATGPIDNWPTFWRYITSGTADPTGRPLTLLTFLLDARNWPADPYPFKRTSLILHLLNGGLLYALLARLGRAAGRRHRAAPTWPPCSVPPWLLHPLLVSTTLYIVQREAMLPATCVLLGLLLWLHGRAAAAAGPTRPGLVWIALRPGRLHAAGRIGQGQWRPAAALRAADRNHAAACAPRGQCSVGTAQTNGYRGFMLLFAWLPTRMIAVAYLLAGVHGIYAWRPSLPPVDTWPTAADRASRTDRLPLAAVVTTTVFERTVQRSVHGIHFTASPADDTCRPDLASQPDRGAWRRGERHRAGAGRACSTLRANCSNPRRSRWSCISNIATMCRQC